MSGAVIEVEIRPARRGDIDAIANLETRAFPSPWRRAFFESELAAERRYATVALDRDGNLLGYLFAMYFEDEMHVNKIAVGEEHRRKGVARALMTRLFDFAGGRGVQTISLEVRKSNTEAQRFYESLQFESLYIRPRYYPDGESAVVMVRTLPPARL